MDTAGGEPLRQMGEGSGDKPPRLDHQGANPVSDDLAIWLREWRPASLDESGRLADDYLMAQKGEGKNVAWLAQNTPGRARSVPGTMNGRPTTTEMPTSYTGGHWPQGQMDGGRSRTNFRGEKVFSVCQVLASHVQLSKQTEAEHLCSTKACTTGDAGSAKYLRRDLSTASSRRC